jgi:hypothetical protein
MKKSVERKRDIGYPAVVSLLYSELDRQVAVIACKLTFILESCPSYPGCS